MIKQFTISLLLLTVSLQFSYGQKLKGSATYSVSTKINFKSLAQEADIEGQSEDEKKLMQILSTVLGSGDEGDVKVELIFNDQASYLKPVEMMEGDKLKLNIAATIADGLGEIYSDYTTLSTLTVDESLGERLLISDSFVRFDWQLTNEKRVINGYNCIKAVGTRNVRRDDSYKKSSVEAWFCPEIPIPTGPAGYGGLPGLIFAVEENKAASYIMTAIKFNINPKELSKIKRPNKGQFMTRIEYDKLLDSIDDN
jgi:GLPGLI family protein